MVPHIYYVTSVGCGPVVVGGCLRLLHLHVAIDQLTFACALRMLRTPQLKPFIIFIKPPAFEFLKETRNSAHARSTFDENNSRGFTDEEFGEIIHSSERIEFMYGHLFDETIINADLSAAFERLVVAVSRVESEPLWVPASWVQ
ncbi:MAGUK p55 sub member 7 [Homalodisca vitripennis]|nr:MAGUK p55 sub member 7 [Homalodisca vitripennis]